MQPCRAPRAARTAMCLAALSMPLAVVAADDAMFFEAVPLVLTASRLPQAAADAPAPITVIDRQLIDDSGFTELHDLLRLVPGFMVADWAGGSPTVANHGLGDAYGRRLKVMIDGRTVNNPFWGNVDWQDLPLRVDDVERIEVVRGPNGAAYGANAFQGVINIITRSARTESGTAVTLRAGHREANEVAARLSGPRTEALAWRISASRRTADNFMPYQGESGEKIERSVANLQIAIQPTLRDELHLQAGATTGFNLSGVVGSLSDPFGKTRIGRNYLQLGWTRTLGPESELSLQYHHQDRSERKSWAIPFRGIDIPTDLDLDSRRDDLELQFTQRLSPAWHILLGAGLRHDAVKSQRYFTANDDFGGTQWQLFSSLTWRPSERLAVNLGGNLEHHYFSGKLFSPRAAVNYRLDHYASLRASTGISYRAPQAWESRSFETVGEGGRVLAIGYWAALPLQPERVRFVELGFAGRIATLSLDLDARVFREAYDNYIDDQACRFASGNCGFAAPPGYVGAPPSYSGTLNKSYVFYFGNNGAVTTTGAEFRADWRKPGWGRVVLSQAFVNIENTGLPGQDIDLEASAPDSMTSLLIAAELPAGWRASLGFYHATRMKWLNDGDVIPSHGRTDLKLSRRFGKTGRESEFALTLQSLEGDYADFHEGNYLHESGVLASLKLAW